jgi:hypothetical protein
MPQDDIIIAKALTAGLRRLLVAAFVHQREITPGAGMAGLNDALRREIARLAMRGETDQGEDVELTAAVRNGLLLFVDAAYREASERQEPPDKIQ